MTPVQGCSALRTESPGTCTPLRYRRRETGFNQLLHLAVRCTPPQSPQMPFTEVQLLPQGPSKLLSLHFIVPIFFTFFNFRMVAHLLLVSFS